MENFVYNVLNNYFSYLSVFGYRKHNSVKKIITLLAIYDLISEDYRGYLKREDYVYIERALECLLGSDCLIPNLNSCGKPVVNTMYYGNTNIDPRVFQSMDINDIFNISNMMTKDIVGDGNITFTINQTSTLHYLIIPEEKMTLVKAEYGSLLVTTLWNGSPEESAYFITNEGGVFNGVKYRVFFSYSPIGAFSEDIRITVKNKI